MTTKDERQDAMMAKKRQEKTKASIVLTLTLHLTL